MMRSALLMFTLLAAACSSSPTSPEARATGSFTLRFGETATFAATPVTFTDVSDSRCPSTVTCVWAGDAAIRLTSGAESLVLHTNTAAGPATGKLAGLEVKLLDVKPPRITPDEVKKSDYVVTLTLSR